MALSTLIAAGGLAAFQGGAARATEPGSDGLLAALGTGSGIVAGDPNGSEQHELPANNTSSMIAWSSDGSRFVESAGYGLELYDADGTNLVQPHGVGWDAFPTWFASNTEIVYENTGLAGGIGDQLYVAPVADTGQDPSPLFGVANTGFCDSDPKARGNLIVFDRYVCGTAAGDDPRNGVWIYDKSTGTAHEVVSGAQEGDISPDGTKLVYVKQADGLNKLFVSALDGSGATRLGTTEPGDGFSDDPVWSPSGKSVAFDIEDVANTLTGVDVDIIDVATGTRRIWMQTNGRPAWQPVNPSAPSAHPGPAPTAALQASVGDLDPATGGEAVTLNATGSTGDGISYSFDFGDGSQPVVSASPQATRPVREGTHAAKVTVTDRWGRTVSSTQWVTVGDGYHPVAPQRLLDTRSGLGAPQGRTTKVTLQLPASVTQQPNTRVTAVVLNVTVTDTASVGNVKVYPHGLTGPAPTTSNLNFVAGQTVANLVTVPVTDGQVQLDVAGAPLSLIADIAGYYTAGPSGSGFAPLTPARLMDTRDGTGNVGGRLPGYGQVSLPVPATVPADATAVVLNVTAVNTQSPGDLIVHPDVPGQPRPVVSNLNFGAGAIVPNLVIVPIPADRKIDFYLHSPGSADLLADIEGYYSPSAPSRFVPWSPLRLVDTRNGDAGGAVSSGSQAQVAVGARFQVPSSALTAGLYNVTVTDPAGPGHVTVYPDGLATVPTVSNLNYTTGQTVPNAVLAPMTDGVEDFYNLGAKTQLIVDFFGYFARPVAPTPPPAAAASDSAAVVTVGHGGF